jgi:shikimate dehydrogenase
VPAGPDFVDDPERYGRMGAGLLELPLERFSSSNPGRLRLLADRASLRTLATVERLEGRGRALLEKAVLARFDYIEIPLETDVETRGRMLAQARKHGVKVVLSQRSARPPRSVESVLRLFQKCFRAGGDLALGGFEVFSADHVRVLREASGAATTLGIPHGIAATGSLAQLASLLPADLVFGSMDGRTDAMDLSLLSRVRPTTRLFAIIGEPAHPSATLEVLNGGFWALGLDCACLQLSPGPDGPGGLVRLLQDMGFQGFLVGRPFRIAAAALVLASGAPPPAVSVLTVRRGVLAGHDTDGGAALDAFDRSGVRVHRRRAVVLGTGGAARSVALALRSRGARVVIAGRNLRRALEAAGAAGAEAAALSSLETVLGRASLLVSAVCGEGGDVVSDSWLRPDLVVMDLDCSQPDGRLPGRAAEAGAHTVGGTAVMARNLSEALRLFTGARPPARLVGRLIDESQRRVNHMKKTKRATKVINLQK